MNIGTILLILTKLQSAFELIKSTQYMQNLLFQYVINAKIFDKILHSLFDTKSSKCGACFTL